MGDRDIRERDILVAPNEYAYVLDLTKGNIILYVGPTKISLSNTERMIVLREGRFVPVRGEEAGSGVHKFVEATSSQYFILENPPQDPAVKPQRGANSTVPLEFGRKVVVPGPAELPLWPGQRAQVIEGHQLRQNEYLVVRRYDDADSDAPIGTETIVRGTDISFYVPDSGLEVVPLGDRYVRQAERMDSNMGLHLRVVSAFEAAEGDQVPAGGYQAGQDIFLRGREGYFFPTDTLEVLGDVGPLPLAEKEGIYVRDLDEGTISTVQGPTNYLIDPTQAELVLRPVDERIRGLYRLLEGPAHAALSVYVPPSTAILVTAKDKREVVVGPQTRILDYDEELEVLTLSTGRPKTDENLLSTCFLQVQGNKVSDVVRLKTGDHVELEVRLSYRVSFVGDSARWFNVKNYVGLLCDHLGSIVRAAGRATSIDTFHGTSTDVVRTAILGVRTDSGGRDGRHFEENGMWVYDVEVLDVQILDDNVDHMLRDAQRTAIASTISRRRQELRLGDQQVEESVNQQIATAKIETLVQAIEFEDAHRASELARVETRAQTNQLEKTSQAKSEAEALSIAAAGRASVADGEAELEQRRLRAHVEAFEKQMGALQPELIATLKALGNTQLVGALSKNLGPLAILGGESVADVVGRLLDRLPLGAGSTPATHGDIQTILAPVPIKPPTSRAKKRDSKSAS